MPAKFRIPDANLIEEHHLEKRDPNPNCADLTVIFASGSITRANPEMFNILAKVMGRENLTMLGLTVPGEETVRLIKKP